VTRQRRSRPRQLSDLRHSGARQREVAVVLSGVESGLSWNIIRYWRVFSFTLYPVDRVGIQEKHERLATVGRNNCLKSVRLEKRTKSTKFRIIVITIDNFSYVRTLIITLQRYIIKFDS